MMQISSLLTNRSIATFYIVLMCIQILAIEGFGVSMVKVIAMGLAPVILLLKVPYISKAFILGITYICIVTLCASFSSYIRFSTIGYLIMFVFTFIMYYNLIYLGAFSSSYFINLLEKFILAFFICALLQQICSGIGIRYIPILNMVGQSYLSPTHFNTLTFEPSSSARILSFLYLAYLRMLQFSTGTKPSIRLLFCEHRWVTIAFLYTMVMMGSGTAMVCIAILSLYFIRKKYLLLVLPLLLTFYFTISFINYEPLQRVLNIINAAMTLDTEEVTIVDSSAAVRVNPLINTLTELDLTSSETWLGKGTVSEEYRVHKNIDTAKIGNINQYGLLSYIVALTLIFSCCIKKFFSVETLLAFITIELTINNISYIWGCYFILTAVRYFESNTKINEYEQSLQQESS